MGLKEKIQERISGHKKTKRLVGNNLTYEAALQCSIEELEWVLLELEKEEKSIRTWIQLDKKILNDSFFTEKEHNELIDLICSLSVYLDSPEGVDLDCSRKNLRNFILNKITQIVSSSEKKEVMKCLSCGNTEFDVDRVLTLFCRNCGRTYKAEISSAPKVIVEAVALADEEGITRIAQDAPNEKCRATNKYGWGCILTRGHETPDDSAHYTPCPKEKQCDFSWDKCSEVAEKFGKGEKYCNAHAYELHGKDVSREKKPKKKLSQKLCEDCNVLGYHTEAYHGIEEAEPVFSLEEIAELLPLIEYKEKSEVGHDDAKSELYEFYLNDCGMRDWARLFRERPDLVLKIWNERKKESE